MRKNPIVAAVLNFLFFGGGYLYLGKKALPALMITAGGLAVQGVEIGVSPIGTDAIPALWPFLLGGLVIAKLGLAVDAFNEAKAAR